MADEPRTTNTFSMDCPTCGPGTIHFLDGEMVPHGCDYQPPSLVLRCEGEPMPTSPAVTDWRRRRRARDVAATTITALIVAVVTVVVVSPIVWALVEFWRWVL